MSRRKSREIAFKVLFQVDQVNADPEEVFEYLLEESKLNDKNKSFSWRLISGSIAYLEEIDEKIAHYSREWNIDRMPAVDRNIMRMASYEMLYIEESEAAIVIDEAIEMSKKYGDESSSSFINAILDKIKHKNALTNN